MEYSTLNFIGTTEQDNLDGYTQPKVKLSDGSFHSCEPWDFVYSTTTGHFYVYEFIHLSYGDVSIWKRFHSKERAMPEESDMVNHPNHYADKQIEVIDYIRDTLTDSGFTDYCNGNVLKYVSRWRKKGGIEDLKKAQVYLGWAIESAEKEKKENE